MRVWFAVAALCLAAPRKTNDEPKAALVVSRGQNGRTFTVEFADQAFEAAKENGPRLLAKTKAERTGKFVYAVENDSRKQQRRLYVVVVEPRPLRVVVRLDPAGSTLAVREPKGDRCKLDPTVEDGRETKPEPFEPEDVKQAGRLKRPLDVILEESVDSGATLPAILKDFFWGYAEGACPVR